MWTLSLFYFLSNFSSTYYLCLCLYLDLDLLLTQPLHAPALHILARRVAPKWRGRHSLAAGNCRSEFFFKNSRGLNEEIMELNCRQALF